MDTFSFKGVTMFKIKTIHHSQMDMNTYLLIKKDEVIVIDPGLNGETVASFLHENNLKVVSVLLTHGHFDHILGLNDLQSFLPFTTFIHQQDLAMLYDPELNYGKNYGVHFKLSKAFQVKQVVDLTELDIINEKLLVLHTPGHTLGSVMFKYQNHIFSGDTLFYDSIGRTDLFSGNFNAIRRSLNMIKSTLSNQNMIYPGHGRSGKLQDIKKTNRFLQ